ncbi:MAG TPA: beta-ketoacyl-[acyl-carrier-protein] synthase II [Nitrospirae bacterium]|nr:3-oxoacyl-[acyl-carrier-protein] synthase 2 [bacterium BMS3Abin09]GBE41681.1 3-oxoacyl-[acyl-carrier-protein] synthase 2 [bacterium BMS3Bbin09]HDO66601.1 beta-ketoacyl-[acyl-carrier-protein] synthase II [Nitrospirota bacterium]HDZ84916.1 beta-ketoacyl-[acyl-carrier-protein] synthase II [Nitrospirota bacterium]HEW80775.1 beta-ketoacyl-[acyl-carrier-protein] synthase II [Nitrospirota bacterium]
MSKRRVVITGVGMVTPLGTGTEKSWKGLLEGRSGIRKTTLFDTEKFSCKISGEVPDFEIDDFIEPKEQKKMDRFIHFALAASTLAMKDSGLKITDSNAEKTGVIVGAGVGGLPAIERYKEALLAKGPKRVSPFFIPMTIINLAAGHISIRFGAKGPNTAIATACASGTHSIGEAYRLIQYGTTDSMIAGGAEAVITPLGIGGFASMKALSTRNDEPEKASRPFDKDRDGFVMGEGSGIMILEEMEHAMNRGARIYGELIGYGLNSDAYHITSPGPGGEGAAKCMAGAIKDAGIAPEEIDYINAHGTSTKYGDELETNAIRTVFKDHAYKLCISSTKSMIGHLLGASGGVEGVICALSLRDQIVPPTINLDEPDTECDLDYVPHKARALDLNIAMSNSFGFGGTNGCIIIKRFDQS